ncbi:MAG: four helix bundle protein [Nitrospirae bacterium]|nr:four helix bundle protein [Nitrospirota bacterium]
MELVTEVYKIAKFLPREENYNLISQMKRAAISIPSNIAEGAARNTKKEFINFLHISQGSLSELDTQLEIVKHLGYLSENDLCGIITIMERIDKMLTGLIKFQKSPYPSRLTPHGKRS